MNFDFLPIIDGERIMLLDCLTVVVVVVVVFGAGVITGLVNLHPPGQLHGPVNEKY